LTNQYYPDFFCEICGKKNKGFSDKYSWESEEQRKKQREYQRRYREKKEKERLEKNKNK